MTCSNCNMCVWRDGPDGGYCAMFKYEPPGVCHQWKLDRKKAFELERDLKSAEHSALATSSK